MIEVAEGSAEDVEAAIDAAREVQTLTYTQCVTYCFWCLGFGF